MLENLKKYKIILGSASPRRQQLLKELGFSFEVKIYATDESFDSHLQREEIVIQLSQKKAAAFENELKDENNLIITGDTIVWINNHVLNKPSNKKEAIEMLNELSDNSHQVFTGITLSNKNKTISFHEETKVYFKKLSSEEIEYYIDTFHPYDKAGSYGVQEWMGYVGMKRIEGCFFNVMGLPLSKLYTELEKI